MSADVCVRRRVFVGVLACACVRVYVHVCMCPQIYVHKSVCVSLCASACVCVFVWGNAYKKVNPPALGSQDSPRNIDLVCLVP